jgi:hypothetical protein
MRSEVFVDVEVRIVALCVMTACSLIGAYRRFGDTNCFHVQVYTGNGAPTGSERAVSPMIDLSSCFLWSGSSTMSI